MDRSRESRRTRLWPFSFRTSPPLTTLVSACLCLSCGVCTHPRPVGHEVGSDQAAYSDGNFVLRTSLRRRGLLQDPRIGQDLVPPVSSAEIIASLRELYGSIANMLELQRKFLASSGFITVEQGSPRSSALKCRTGPPPTHLVQIFCRSDRPVLSPETGIYMHIKPAVRIWKYNVHI